MSLLVLVVFIAATIGLVASAGARTLISREDITLILARQDVYQTVTAAITEGIAQDFAADRETQASNQGDADTIDQTALSKIIERYFTPEFYNHAVNTTVNSIYDWLEGKVTRPDFDIKITEDKQQFQNFIITVFTDRFRSLPNCPPQVKTDRNFNPLEASCRPVGVSEEYVKIFITEQTEQPEFQQLYERATISSDQIIGPIDADTAESLRQWWRVARWLPWIVFGSLIVSLLLLGLLSSKSRRFRIPGLVLLVPSAISLFGAAILSTMRQNIVQGFIEQEQRQSTAADQLLKLIAESLFQLINTKILVYSGLLCLIAFTLLAVNRIHNRRGQVSTLKFN